MDACADQPLGLARLALLSGGPLPAAGRSARSRFERQAPTLPRGRRSSLRTAPLELEGCRLVIVGGKGGVGKSSVAAAIAFAEARRRDVVLLSTDPAHSLGDVLCRPIGDPGARLAPRLWVRELDAGRAMERRRRRVREGIEALFDGLRRRALDLAYDRAILADLLDMTPPGMDQLMALLEIVELTDGRAQPGSLLVLDTAPTGHTLRLLAMPAQVLEWVHAVLGICLKYRGVVKLGDIAADLLALSRELRSLAPLLCDPVRTRFIPVLRPERLPCEETADLLARLRSCNQRGSGGDQWNRHRAVRLVPGGGSGAGTADEGHRRPVGSTFDAAGARAPGISGSHGTRRPPHLGAALEASRASRGRGGLGMMTSQSVEDPEMARAAKTVRKTSAKPASEAVR